MHVLGADLGTMLAHTWAAGAFGTGAPSWPDFLARLRARRRLPRRVDLPGVVERFRARPHTGRVGVVLDLGELPGLVGVRRLEPVSDVPAHATELARQVGAALSLLVLPAEQAALLSSVLRPRLAGVAGALPDVPPEHRDWVEDAAFGLRQRLLRARYPVVGDPDRLLPGWSGSPGTRGNLTISGRCNTPDRQGSPEILGRSRPGDRAADGGGTVTSKVLLHVGTPKTGTSYFQDVLFRNREVLAAAGIAYPASRHDSHFLAALDLMQLPWGGLQSDAIGAWDDLAREVREALSTGRAPRSSATRSSRPPRGRRSVGRSSRSVIEGDRATAPRSTSC